MNATRRKKPVLPQSEIFKLHEAQQNQIIDWLVSGMSLSRTREKINTEFKLNLKSDISTFNYWNAVSETVMRWQDYRPKHISAVGWEVTRREYVKELEKPGLPLELRKAIIKFLETGRFQKSNSSDAQPSSENKPVEEINPLDDDDKLEEIRNLLFGPPPVENTPPEITEPAPPEGEPNAAVPNPLV